MTEKEKISYFKTEIEKITETDLYNFVEKAVKNLDDYVFIKAGSSSGKFHPLSDLGEGGLLRHIKSVFYIGYDLLQLEHFQKLFSLRDREIILISLLLHDAKKYGEVKIEEGEEKVRFHTIGSHPLIASDWVKSQDFNDIIPEEDRIKISKCIASHSGQWNTNKAGEDFLPKPSNGMEFFVHMCDYIASRRYLDFDLSKLNTKIKETIKPEDFILTFGQKHNGHSLQEIYNNDKQYLLWAEENMKREPAHTYIVEFMKNKRKEE